MGLFAKGIVASTWIVSIVTLASQVKTQSQWGAIDWSRRVITATGIGAPPPNIPPAAARPNAIRAAQMTAVRNALEIVKGIPITSTTTVDNRMVSNDIITTKVEGVVRGFEQQGRTRYMNDGSVEITMEIPLDGDLADAVLPPEIADTPSVGVSARDAKKNSSFTGLIVDCTGLGITPSIAPAILDETGATVVGAGHLSRTWAIKWGVVSYASAITSAQLDAERIGLKPLIVKAVKAAGQPKINAVLSKKDAAAVRNNTANYRVLQECRIIFIIG